MAEQSSLMATQSTQQPTIKYAKEWGENKIDHVSFSPNNLVGNFAYPDEVPAYKLIVQIWTRSGFDEIEGVVAVGW